MNSLNQFNLCSLARMGKLNDVQMLIQNNSKYTYPFDFNWALFEACDTNQKEIAEYLINTHGANDFNKAFRWACHGGHKELAKWLIDAHGANDFNWALSGACWGNQTEIIKWLIDTYPIDVNRLDTYTTEYFSLKNLHYYSTLEMSENDDVNRTVIVSD